MKRVLRRRILVATAAGIAVGVWAGIATASSDPPAPPGLRPDGTLDVSQLPGCVPIGKGDGTDAIAGCVDRELLFAPPSDVPPDEGGPKGGPPTEAGLPVKGPGGDIVGRYFPDRGFVPEPSLGGS